MNGSTRVVLTGLGAVTAAGHGHGALWAALMRGAPLFQEITRFAPGSDEPKRAAQVAEFSAEKWLSPALIRQTDVSTHYAFAGARLALEDAGLALDDVNRDRVGVMVGHAFGGMDYAEQQLYNQWVLGPEEVGPYQAIAWFYAATMGQLSIQLGLRGYSKAFVADRCSGMHAIGHAVRVIQSGRIDCCLAGGTEAPLSPFMYRTVVSSGHVSCRDYLPFSREASGFILGEGSCFLVLESLDHARRRGAVAYAEVSGYASTTDPVAGYGFSTGSELERCQKLALAGAASTGVDHVITDGAAVAEADRSELVALTAVLKANPRCKISAPKAVVGEMYGGGAPVQVLAGALALKRSTCLPLVTPSDALWGDPYTPPHARACEEQDVRSVLINSRGVGGINASLVLTRIDPSETQ